jgi:hypothetical protein
LLVRSEFGAFLAMRASTPSGLTSADSRSPLPSSSIASPGPLMPLGMFFGERRAFLKHRRGSHQDR